MYAKFLKLRFLRVIFTYEYLLKRYGKTTSSSAYELVLPGFKKESKIYKT